MKQKTVIAQACTMMNKKVDLFIIAVIMKRQRPVAAE